MKRMVEGWSGVHRTWLLSMVAVLCSFDATALADRPLNIVFILADNQSAAALPAYGNRDGSTPHLDKLAARGVRYDNAFAVSGMCSPTRATLMTGLMPSQHGLHNALHDAWVDQLEPGWSAVQEFRTVPATLRGKGYQTAMIGKWHIGDPRTARLGFEHWVALPYGHTRDFWHNRLVENGPEIDVDDRHIVDVLAQKAVDYLQQVDTGKPFYLQLNLDGPYALPPTNYGPARNRHYRRFAGRDFASMPVEPVNDRILKRLTGPFIASHAIENGVDGMSLDEIWNSLLYRTMRMQGDRDSYANFLSQNKLVDDAVGSVWKALVERGLDGNTIVIYSSDQGNLFGQHGSWGHTIWFWPAHLFDAAMRIPLIVYHPEVRERGVASDRLVGQYDLAPTLLALAGVTEVELEDSPGKSLVPDLLGKPDRAEAPGAVFFEQEESRGIRTREYAYWKRADGMGEPELYDVAGDPEQRNDLFPQRRNDDIVAQLDGELESFFARYSTAEYDLWHGGVAKGTTPNPVPWLKAHPLPWIKKFWRDFVTGPVVADRFEE